MFFAFFFVTVAISICWGKNFYPDRIIYEIIARGLLGAVYAAFSGVVGLSLISQNGLSKFLVLALFLNCFLVSIVVQKG